MKEAKKIAIGPNRTGVDASPLDSQELLEATRQFPPSSPGGPEDAARVRTEYAEESGAVGSVPPPLSAKGVVKAAVQLLQGRPPAVLLDKLAERLAFERSGTRLYELLLAKFDAEGSFVGGPSRQELELHRDEELRHVHLLQGAIERLGGDPTAQTPGADLMGVVSLGAVQAFSDPRVSLPQTLQALLTTELTDNDGWRMLIELSAAYGQDEMAAEFRVAEAAEARHLGSVRAWLASRLAIDAKTAPGELQEQAA